MSTCVFQGLCNYKWKNAKRDLSESGSMQRWIKDILEFYKIIFLQTNRDMTDKSVILFQNYN